MSEPFSWKKFLYGLIDPTAYFKTAAILVRIALLALVIYAIFLGGVKIHNMIAPKKQNPSVFNVTGQQGGEVKNSADQKTQKNGLIVF